jgi:hypothetical protein
MPARKAFFFSDMDDLPEYAPGELAMWNELIPRLGITETRMRNRCLADPAQSMVNMTAAQKKAELLQGLSWLTAGAQPGDTLFFFISTHGNQVSDSGPVDETDKRDEAVVVVSSVPDANGRLAAINIRDDEIRNELLKAQQNLEGVALYAFSSACCSGTWLDLPHHFVTVTDENKVDSLAPYDQTVANPAKFPAGCEVVSIGSSQDAYLTRHYPMYASQNYYQQNPGPWTTPTIPVEVAPGVTVNLGWFNWDNDTGPGAVNSKLVALLRAVVKGAITPTTTHQQFMNAYMAEAQALTRDVYWYYETDEAKHPVAPTTQYNVYSRNKPVSPEQLNPVFGFSSFSMLQSPCRIVPSPKTIVVARNAITNMTNVTTTPTAYCMAPSSTATSAFFTPVNTYGRDVYVVYKIRSHPNHPTASKVNWQFEIKNDGKGLSQNVVAVWTGNGSGSTETVAEKTNTKYSVQCSTISTNGVYTIKARIPPGFAMTSTIFGIYGSKCSIDYPIFVFPENLVFV